VFFHESGHSLDQGTSPGDAWTAALAASSCVPDDYANSSPAEDFAQMEVTYAFWLHTGSLPSDPSCLQPQLDYMNSTDRIRTANTVSQCDDSIRPFTLYTPPTTAVASAPSTTAAPSSTVAPSTTTAPATTPSVTTTSASESSSASSCPAGKRRRSEIRRRKAEREALRRA